jgi:hypothetical protein
MGWAAIYGILGLLAGVVAGGVWLLRPYFLSLGRPGCPNCGSGEIRISFRSGVADRVFGLFSCEPYRCKVCYYRFYKAPVSGRTKLVSHGS